MVEISNLTKNPEYNYGVDISVIMRTKEPNKENFIGDVNFDLANELYSKTADHVILESAINNLTKLENTYDANNITDLFVSLITVDQQLYYDCIAIIKAITMAKDQDLRTKFLDDIKNVGDENYTVDTTESEEKVETDEDGTVIIEDKEEENK